MQEPIKARLFLDASVLFAAAFSTSGSAAFLMSECRGGKFRAVTSRLVLIEVARNIMRKADSRAFSRFVQFIEDPTLEILGAPTSPQVKRYFKHIHAKDAHVLASADLGNCSFIITWDKKHFKTKSLESYPLNILTPESL